MLPDPAAGAARQAPDPTDDELDDSPGVRALAYLRIFIAAGLLWAVLLLIVGAIVRAVL